MSEAENISGFFHWIEFFPAKEVSWSQVRLPPVLDKSPCQSLHSIWSCSFCVRTGLLIVAKKTPEHHEARKSRIREYLLQEQQYQTLQPFFSTFLSFLGRGGGGRVLLFSFKVQATSLPSLDFRVWTVKSESLAVLEMPSYMHFCMP